MKAVFLATSAQWRCFVGRGGGFGGILILGNSRNLNGIVMKNRGGAYVAPSTHGAHSRKYFVAPARKSKYRHLGGVSICEAACATGRTAFLSSAVMSAHFYKLRSKYAWLHRAVAIGLKASISAGRGHRRDGLPPVRLCVRLENELPSRIVCRHIGWQHRRFGYFIVSLSSWLAV